MRLLLSAGRGPAGCAWVVAEEWTGTLCWQAPSPWRRVAGRKNWFVAGQRLAPAPPPATFHEGDVTVVAIRTGGRNG